MRIRKLELYGFKSFPERTSLVFGPGVSCIVGPNGCGKSNLVDAVKWCIGERSARSLRGSEMTDVVFAGSADRAPVGFAEVKLTLGSEGGEPFPGDYASYEEIEVGRRLYRTGASEYTLNRARCRRKDVVELFLDTGVGNTLYSFVEQDRIGKIVHATAQDRRQLIDEAAGITRYRARREEARQQLDATGAQLDRAADVADEMGRRLRALRRQVVKAARFRRLRELVRGKEITLSLIKYAALAADRRALRDQAREVRVGLAGIERESARRETDLQRRLVELERAEAVAGELRDEVAEQDARRRELEREREYEERTASDLAERLARQGVLGEEAERVRRDREAAVVSIGEELEGLLEAAREAQVRLDEQLATLAEAEPRVASARAQLSGAGAEVAELVREADASRARVTELGRRRDEALARTQRLEAALLGAEQQQRRLVDRTAQLDARLAARQELDERESLGLPEVEAALVQARGLEEAARERLVALQARLDEARGQGAEQVQVLEEELRRAEDVGAERVEAAETDADREAAGVRLEAARGVDRVRERVRGELHQAEERARRWLEALHRAADAAREESRAVLERAEHEAEQGWARRYEALVADGELRVTQAEAEAAARSREAVERHRELRDVVAASLAATGREQADLESRRSVLVREVQATQGRLAAVDAELERAAVLPGVLDDAPRLVDVIGPQRVDEDVRALAGARLLLPVIRDEGELRRVAAAARTAGPVEVIWAPGPDPLARLLTGLEVVDDLDQALDIHRRTGRAVHVRATGERLGSDGVVRLGPEDDGVSRILELESERSHLSARLAGHADDLARVERALGEVDQERTALRRSVQDADDQVLLAVEEGRAAVRRAGDEARSTARTALDEARRQWMGGAESGLQTLRARQRALSERYAELTTHARLDGRRTLDRLRQGARAEVDRAEAVARQAVDLQLAGIEAGLKAARAEARAAVDEVRSRLEEGRELARAGLQPLLGEIETEQARLGSLQQRRAEVEARHAALVHRDREAEVVRLGLESDLRAARAQLAGAGARVEELRAEVQAARREQEALELEIHGAARAQAGVERSLAIAEQAHQRRRAEQDEAEAELDGIRDEVSRGEREGVALEERRRALEAALGTARGDVVRAEEHHQAAMSRVAELQQALAESRSRARLGVERLSQIVVHHQQAVGRLDEARARIAELRDERRASEDALRVLVERREAAIRQVSEVEHAVRDVKLEVERLRARMDERYQVSLPGLLDRVEAQGHLVIEPDPSVRDGLRLGRVVVDAVEPMVVRSSMLEDAELVAELVEEARSHREELAGFGELNLAALDEYHEVEERHAELVEQRADLEESVRRIRKAIARMNRQCRQRFRDAFERVDQRFRETYPRLVGGGSARLSLTDQEDLLESGVDIFVQPPGKRLQNLRLLSGGEKAMTGIALILALFQVKPAPFCLLDEVDAPLDEANGVRFNEMLRELADVSQFVLVTHNRKTMESADVLYGVTMPTPGVSRLVSVRLGA